VGLCGEYEVGGWGISLYCQKCLKTSLLCSAEAQQSPQRSSAVSELGKPACTTTVNKQRNNLCDQEILH